MKWAGRVAYMGENMSTYTILVGNPEGKRPLGRLKRRREETIKTDLREIGCTCGLNSSGSGQGTSAGSREHGNEPSGSIKCLEIIEWLNYRWLL
jgi:hypothetical protein